MVSFEPYFQCVHSYQVSLLHHLRQVLPKMKIHSASDHRKSQPWSCEEDGTNFFPVLTNGEKNEQKYKISFLLLLLFVHKDQGLLSGLVLLGDPLIKEEKCPIGLLRTVGFCHQI